MDKAIAIFEKSLLESAAQVKAEMAKAKAVEAEEIVKTVRESENAKRRTTVEIMLARKNADEKRIEAEAHAIRAAVDAEAQKLLYEAENALTDEARYGLFRRRLLDRIEGIVRESVKPMEKIEGIRILHVDGLGGMAGNGGGSSRTPTDEVIEFGAALPGAGAADRSGAEGNRDRGRQPRQDGRADARGQRHAAGRQGSPAAEAEGRRSRPAGAVPDEPKPPAAAAKARARSDRMARVYVSSVINAPAAKVWARVRDFNGLPNWHPGIAREPDRERRAGRQGRLRQGVRAAQRRPAARKAARPVGLRHALHLFDPGYADAADQLRRDAAADPGHRRIGPSSNGAPISTARRSWKPSWSPASAAMCSRPVSTRSTAHFGA